MIARLLDAGGARLVDEGMPIAGAATTQLDWDVASVAPVPAGAFDLVVTAAGLAPQTFTLTSTAAIDEVVAVEEGEQPGLLLRPVGWSHCMAVRVDATTEVTFTGTEPGGGSASLTVVAQPL